MAGTEQSEDILEQEQPGKAAAQPAPRYAPVTWRAVVLGLFGAIHVSIIQLVAKVVPQNVILPYHSALTLMAGAVFWLFVLAVLNVPLRRRLPRFALRPAEFAVVYGMTTVAAGIAAQDEAPQLFPMFVYPFRATQNDLMGPFRQYIPTWLIPQDPKIVEPYFMGGGSFWTPERMAAWLIPLCSWMTWLTVLGATMWAWNVILRRRWLDHDRLSFPCVQLPMEMCRAGGFGGMLSGRLFWSGLAFSTLLESLEQLHNRFPAVPSMPLGFAATPLLEAAPAPWNALAPMYLAWSTLHLGICYLIPMDILFSAWFFYLFRKGMEVFGYAMGWRDIGWDAPGFPYTRVQAAGAWIALFFVLVWAERHHLRRVLSAALSFEGKKGRRGEREKGRQKPLLPWPSRKRRFAPLAPSPLPGPNDADEPASYRWAGRILLGGTVFLIAFSVAAGMSLWLTLAFYAFFWMLNVTMTRIYAQVGPPMLELYFLDPQKTLTTIFGTIGQSPRSLTMFSLMYWINRTDRGHPMAHQLAAFFVNKPTRTQPRALGKWALVAFVVGALTCLLTGLHWAYKVGEDQYVQGGWREAFAPVGVSRINEWVSTPKGPQWKEIGFMAGGGVFTLILAKLNYTFIGFPFHPVGFAMAMCFAVEYNWPAYLMMWLFKGLLLRYGGRSLYLHLVPFFFGLVLGGFVIPVGWGFIAWAFEWYR